MKPFTAFVACAVAAALQSAPGAMPRAAGPAAPDAVVPLSVCLAEDNRPFSASQPVPEGVDFDVAGELARRLERPLRVAWVDIPARGGLEKAVRSAFKDDRCTLFFGIPLAPEPAKGRGVGGPEASMPYRSAAYVLVSGRSGTVHSLEDARRARRIGAVTATPADLFLFAHGFARAPYANNADLLAALSSDAVDAAVMWMPALAQLEREGRTLWAEAVRHGEITDPGLRTDFVIAMRGGAEAAARIDDALRQMHEDGALAAIAQGLRPSAPN